MTSYHEKERELVASKKLLLPAHAGESRYQAALDADRKFREMVLGAYALALFSGVGFGQMAATAGQARTILFSLIAVGFARELFLLEPLQQRLGGGLGIAANADGNFLYQSQHLGISIDLDHFGLRRPVIQSVLRQCDEGAEAGAECQHYIGLRDQLHAGF